MKDSYERIKLTITEFQQEDVIVTSDPTPVTPEEPTDHYMIPIR